MIEMINCEPVDISVGDSLVILDGPEKTAIICGVKIRYREGVWCEQEDGEWMPDWGLTWFYTDNPEACLYCEQDPPETAIHNLAKILSVETMPIQQVIAA